jgi:hypothetical protein
MARKPPIEAGSPWPITIRLTRYGRRFVATFGLGGPPQPTGNEFDCGHSLPAPLVPSTLCRVLCAAGVKHEQGADKSDALVGAGSLSLARPREVASLGFGLEAGDAITASRRIYKKLVGPMVPTSCTDPRKTRVRVKGGRVHEVAPLVTSQRGFCLFGGAS